MIRIATRGEPLCIGLRVAHTTSPRTNTVAMRGKPLCSGLRVAQTASPSGDPARLQSATHALLRRATRFAATAPQAPFAQRLTARCASAEPRRRAEVPH